jgi:hypothetical protein
VGLSPEEIMETVGWLLDKDKFLYGGLDTKVMFHLY